MIFANLYEKGKWKIESAKKILRRVNSKSVDPYTPPLINVDLISSEKLPFVIGVPEKGSFVI